MHRFNLIAEAIDFRRNEEECEINFLNVQKDEREKSLVMWCLQNSPYDLTLEDLELMSQNKDAHEMATKVNTILLAHQLPTDASLDNTVFVQML